MHIPSKVVPMELLDIYVFATHCIVMLNKLRSTSSSVDGHHELISHEQLPSLHTVNMYIDILHDQGKLNIYVLQNASGLSSS